MEKSKYYGRESYKEKYPYKKKKMFRLVIPFYPGDNEYYYPMIQ